MSHTGCCESGTQFPGSEKSFFITLDLWSVETGCVCRHFLLDLEESLTMYAFLHSLALIYSLKRHTVNVLKFQTLLRFFKVFF